MEHGFVEKRKAYLCTGGLGLVITAGYMGLAMKLPFGTLDQTGAAIFPLIVGCLMITASLAVIRDGLKMPSDQHVEVPVGAGRFRLIGLIVLMLAYMLVLPYAGPMISAFVFCALLIRLLSSLRWLPIVLYAILMSAGLYILFVMVLKVPLPRGMVGF